MLTLNGLRIARLENGEETEPLPCDVVWHATRAAELRGGIFENTMAPFVRGEPSFAGPLTHHIFGQDGQAYCHFCVSADGGTVTSAATPIVLEADVFSMFCEPVMRSILFKLGLASFHAAALTKNGRTILLMGNKGAGKSTLSAALQQGGWSLLTDDLVRLSEAEGVWSAHIGHRLVKLLPDVLQALGFDAEATAGRWVAPADVEAEERYGKRILPVTGNVPTDSGRFPVSAVFLLMPREAELDTPRCVPVPAIVAVRSLFENATPDPLYQGARPPKECERAISGLMRQSMIRHLTLPDRLADLLKCADQVEDMLADVTA